MNYKFKKENYNFWKNRLKSKPIKKVCTNDLNLDVLESKQILDENLQGKTILEIGCGNGLLYNQICKKHKIKKYIGIDFVKELIEFCKRKKKNTIDEFVQLDLSKIKKNTFKDKFDYIISKRVIQNLTSQNLQLKIIDSLGLFLKKNGFLILVESSKNAQKNINQERKIFKLKKIIPPFHNLFLDDKKIKNHVFKNIKLINIHPFASDFYYTTRLIYAIYAKFFLKKQPLFSHPLQKVALNLSINSRLSTTRYSQVQKYIFKKK
jgi:2-polyprenyl-3-methyl-5-hydroxy-6-metoxy-1,4-benzoquinol methylase